MDGKDIGQSEFIMRGIKLLDELKIKPWSSQGYLFLGELYLNTGKTEKGRGDVSEDGDGLLAGQDAGGFGKRCLHLIRETYTAAIPLAPYWRSAWK